MDHSVLLGRIASSKARVVTIVAPAGYGKSRLARRLLRHAPGQVADCADMTDVSNALCALLRVLGPFERPFADRLSRHVLELPQDAAAPRAIEILEEGLRRPEGSAIACIDSCELLAESRPVAELVERALRDPRRRFILCSRLPLKFKSLARMSPHERYDVGVGDLRLGDEELEALLAPMGASTPDVKRAIDLSRGWPIAALTFLHAAREGRLTAELDAIERGSLAEGLAAYTFSQALGSLSPHARDVLAAIVLLGKVGADELRTLTGAPVKIAAEFAACPFVSRVNDKFDAHPLAAAALAALREGGARVLSRAAARATDPIRSAQLYVAAGEHERAAKVLEGALAPYPRSESTPQLAALITSLGESVYLRHPAMWSATWPMRVFTVTPQRMLLESRMAWKALDARTPLAVRFGVGFSLLTWLCLTGEADEVEAQLEHLGELIRHEPADSQFSVMLDSWRVYWMLRQGRRVDVDACLRRWAPALATVPLAQSLVMRALPGSAAFLRGDRDQTRRSFARAVDLASLAGSEPASIVALVNAAFFAWLADEDALFTSLVERLREASAPHVAPGARHFIGCASGDRPAQTPLGTELPYLRAFGWLVAAGREHDSATRRTTLLKAIEAAAVDRQPWLLALTWASLGLADHARSGEAFANAKRFAAQVEYPEFRSSIEDLTRGTIPEAWPALRAFSDAEPLPVEVRVLRVAAAVGGEERALAGRELEVLVALALSRGKAEREHLAERIWPDHPPNAARQNLKVYVNRLRRHFGAEAIVTTHNEYALGPHVAVDLERVEPALARARQRAAALTDDEWRALARASETDLDALGAKTCKWEWFLPVLAHLESTVRKANLTLSRHHVTWQEWAEALPYAERLFEQDPADTLAFELLVQALQGLGDILHVARATKAHEAALAKLGVIQAPKPSR